jgi:hypothetical protein
LLLLVNYGEYNNFSDEWQKENESSQNIQLQKGLKLASVLMNERAYHAVF